VNNYMVWNETFVSAGNQRLPYWSGHRKLGGLREVGVVQVGKRYLVAALTKAGTWKAPVVLEEGGGHFTGDLGGIVNAANDGQVYVYSRLKDAKDRAAEDSLGSFDLDKQGPEPSTAQRCGWFLPCDDEPEDEDDEDDEDDIVELNGHRYCRCD